MIRPLILLALLTTPATAQTFDEALETWLAGDDMAALEALGDLARDGDADAQLFLGQIASQSLYWPPEVAALPRKKRNGLLRAPGGLSGKSWTAIAAETNPRAQAFDAVTRVGQKAEAMGTLLEMGEIHAVEKAFPGFVASGEDWTGALEIAMHPVASDRISVAAPGLDAAIRTGGNGVINIITSLPRTTLRPDAAAADPSLVEFEGARIAQMADVAPFVDFCEASCGADGVAQCMGAIWVTSTNDPALLVSSPVESLLATDTYRDSPRAVGDAAAAINVTQFRLDQSADPALARLSTCAWDGVQASSSASQ